MSKLTIEPIYLQAPFFAHSAGQGEFVVKDKNYLPVCVVGNFNPAHNYSIARTIAAALNQFSPHGAKENQNN